MTTITPRQQDVLDAIKKHIREHGMAPSHEELAQSVGLSDPASVKPHLQELVKKGFIQIKSRKYRGIRVLDDVPLLRPLAEVAAGTPIVCDAHIVEQVPAAIAERFRPRADYLLTVRGDSMDQTGLNDGDVVAVHKTSEATTGDIVVARLGDEVTLKRFVQIDERHVELRPESFNPAHEVTKLDLALHILRIEGIAVGGLIVKLSGKADGEPDQDQEPARLTERAADGSEG